MPINVHKDGGFTVTGPEGMNFYRMAALKGALSLEMKGLRVTRNFSAYATIKREYHLRGTRQSVYEQFCKLVDEQSSKVTRIYEQEGRTAEEYAELSTPRGHHDASREPEGID